MGVGWGLGGVWVRFGWGLVSLSGEGDAVRWGLGRSGTTMVVIMLARRKQSVNTLWRCASLISHITIDCLLDGVSGQGQNAEDLLRGEIITNSEYVSLEPALLYCESVL